MYEDILSELDDKLKCVEKFLNTEINKYSCGRADKSLIENIKVLYYGSLTPISQMSFISVLDVRTLIIKPYDKSYTKSICSAIIEKNLGINPLDDGDSIKIIFPQMSEERRNEIAKLVEKVGENAKVSIRNVRRDFIDKTKQLKKDGESEDVIKRLDDSIQKIIDKAVVDIEGIVNNKKNDIMTI